MKCVQCGAPTRVLETRFTDTHATRRRRECDNLHRFSTFEVVGPAVNSGTLARAEATVRARIARWTRDRAIRLSKVPAPIEAARRGLSVARIHDVRQGRRSGARR